MTLVERFGRVREVVPGLARDRRVQVLAAVVVVMALLAGFMWTRAQLPEDAVARVDGTVVTTAELRREVATLRALYGVQVPTDDADAFWRAAAQALVVSRVLDQAAADDGVVVDERKVEESLASYLAALYGGAADTQDRFVRALATARTSRRAVLDEIRRRLLVAELNDRATATADAPSDTEVEAQFVARGCTLEVEERRRLRNIVVASETAAEEIAEDLSDGASFADLARTRGEGESDQDVEGELGTVSRGQLESAYGAAAFAAKKGATFGPVRTESGWNVGQVVGIEPARTADRADVLAALREQLLLEERSDLWGDWLRTTLRDADVTYADTYAPDDPDALPPSLVDPAGEGRCSPLAEGPR